jgi:CRISPR-associated protein Cas1
VVDHPQTTYSHHALTELAENGATVVLCGPDHLPAALLLPMIEHSQVVWRIRDQIGATRPLQKRLWQQIVVAKVKGQARNLPDGSPAQKKLLALAGNVRSGDPANIEAQAARIYWQHWLWAADDDVTARERFRRDPDGEGLNGFLNYGYAIVRAAISRAIVSAGLTPAVGIHHSNRANAFCLADDLIEPFRPLVDDHVRELDRQGYENLDQETKARLLELLTVPLELKDETGPAMVMLHRMIASLVRCFAGESRQLEIPQLCR